MRITVPLPDAACHGPPRTSLLLRAFIAGLGATAIVLSVYSLVAVVDPFGRRMYLRILHSSAWSLGFATLALLIAWRGGWERGVLLAGLFLGVMATQASLGSFGVAPDESPLVGPFLIAFGGLGYAVGVRFTQSFPVPLSRASLHGLRGGVLWRGFVALPSLLLDGRLFWPFVVGVEVVQHGVFSDASIVWHALVYAGLASFYLWAGLKTSSEEDRRRGYWILEGVLVFLVLEGLWAGVLILSRTIELPFELGPFTVWLTVLEGWAALICFAIAIFFYGAFNSALVIRRTAVLSVLSACTLVSMVAVEELLAEQLGAATGIDTGVGAILGGVLAALAFRPLSIRIDRMLKGPSAEEASE